MARFCLAVPALLLLLLFLLSTAPTTAEVLASLSACDQFLLDRTPPRIPGILEDGKILDQNRYKTICQTYKNKRCFVTLYDTRNKIPVFSANRYRGVWEKKRPASKWKVEPQLENVENGENMEEDKGRNCSHQAGNGDHRNNGSFDRGHLFPSSYGFNRTDKTATFTLTNIDPQAASLNKGSWNRMETCVRCLMDRHCVNSNNLTEGFVVTGARPSVAAGSAAGSTSRRFCGRRSAATAPAGTGGWPAPTGAATSRMRPGTST
ncbi:endonuclease domain-containing 1 protein-like [Betta splendens]|uniref:Endonuclease domain-containing 1 protein-like n=1 Tax=Betta splendens TaxID=158456 RepID=A0A6P7PBX9_BETSP|nr:endonuclease domain-containing 1 protein-like [Betta splendens]